VVDGGGIAEMRWLAGSKLPAKKGLVDGGHLPSDDRIIRGRNTRATSACLLPSSSIISLF
jgi:hypothetical protein